MSPPLPQRDTAPGHPSREAGQQEKLCSVTLSLQRTPKSHQEQAQPGELCVALPPISAGDDKQDMGTVHTPLWASLLQAVPSVPLKHEHGELELSFIPVHFSLQWK